MTGRPMHAHMKGPKVRFESSKHCRYTTRNDETEIHSRCLGEGEGEGQGARGKGVLSLTEHISTTGHHISEMKAPMAGRWANSNKNHSSKSFPD